MNKGWKHESARHSLAARGMKTKCPPKKSYARTSDVGSMAEYEEVEFACVNSDFPDWERRREQHEAVFKELSKLKGVYPYRQDFSDMMSEGGVQTSLAVIVLEKKKMKDVKRIAEKHGLPIDIIAKKGEVAVDEIIDGEIPFKMEGST